MSLETELNYIVDDLTRHRKYADYKRISEHVYETYFFILELLAEKLPAANKLFKSLVTSNKDQKYLFLGDAVVRDSLNKIFGELKNGNIELLHAAESIFDQYTSILNNKKIISPLQSGMEKLVRFKNKIQYPWLWYKDGFDNSFERNFTEMFEKELVSDLDPKPKLIKPDSEMELSIEDGFNLLIKLLPELFYSAMYHVHIIAIVDVENEEDRIHLFESASTNDIPNTIFLSPLSLKHAVQTAESLLHEALHKKFADLILICSVLQPGYSAKTSEQIYIEWRKMTWPVDRVLAAFHVYVYLVALYIVIYYQQKKFKDSLGFLSSEFLKNEIQKLNYRAKYLGDKLTQPLTVELGPEGKQFTYWLIGVLQRLDSIVGSIAQSKKKSRPTLF